jgi:transcriptional regulator with XRE-family HTH domain
MSIKERRKAHGWNRSELARRAGLERSVMQLVELGQWSESDALERVQRVLDAADAGDTTLVLPPPAQPS